MKTWAWAVSIRRRARGRKRWSRASTISFAALPAFISMYIYICTLFLLQFLPAQPAELRRQSSHSSCAQFQNPKMERNQSPEWIWNSTPLQTEKKKICRVFVWRGSDSPPNYWPEYWRTNGHQRKRSLSKITQLFIYYLITAVFLLFF